MTDKFTEAAQLLARLSTKGETIERLPESLRPSGEADAIAIQRAFLATHTSPGWKVGRRPDDADWCAAPLRGERLSSPATLAVSDAATMRVEVEVALVLGADLPPGALPADVVSAIASAHLAFELFRSSYDDPGGQDFASLLADNLSNAGIVLGSAQPLSSLDLAALHLELLFDGEPIGTVRTGAALETLVAALTWLSDYASSLGAPLVAGTVIITGARIGPVSVGRAGHYLARRAPDSGGMIVELFAGSSGSH